MRDVFVRHETIPAYRQSSTLCRSGVCVCTLPCAQNADHIELAEHSCCVCCDVCLATQDADRIESAKAGASASLGGMAAYLPLVFASGETGPSALLTVLAALGTTFLFGVTYRWVRVCVVCVCSR